MDRILNSVRGRAALAAVAGTLIATFLVGFLVLAGARRDEQEALDQRLERRATLIARPGTIEPFLGGEERPIQRGVAATLLAVNDLGVRIIEHGELQRTAGDAPPSSVPPTDGLGPTTVRDGRASWRVVSRSVAGRPGGRIEVTASMAPVRETIRRLRRRILVIGLAGLLLAAALAAIAAGRAVAALGRLRDAAGGVADTQHLGRRVPQEGPTEVADVAAAVNALLGRLERSVGEREQAYESTRRFAADAGHELRTPLTTLGMTLETLERNPDLPPAERSAVIEEALQEQRRLTTLVTALQALTRGEAGELGDEQLLDPAQVIAEAVRVAARDEPLQLDAELGSVPRLLASPAGLRLLIDNLLRNAAQHARGDREAAHVIVSLVQQGDELVLTVDDDGPGIPAAERDRVVGRFARGRGAQGDGSGLGLALADQQARRLGGALTLGESPAGGLRATVTIPLPTDEEG